MDNLGQYLKAIREEKNFSLESVHNELKLSIEQIEAIESNRLTVLGNYGFAKAMVYSYVRFLDADEKTAMSLFNQIWPSQKQTDFTPRKPIKEKKVLISTNFIWLIAIIVIVIILGAIIWVSYSRGYLERPFQKLKAKPDSIVTVRLNEQQPEKPDTLRARMLKIARETRSNQVKATDARSKASTSIKNAIKDTTDYVNEVLFQDKESPFNQRF
jgi:cytoskeletal protein RodZ